MSGHAPAAIRECWNTIHARMPRAQLSGIFANKPGYHNARGNLPGSDYSVQRADDRAGDRWAAAALDVTMNPADMRAVTQRLINATRARDSRIMVCRSFFGTVNGSTVTGLDVRDNRWVTSDSSHLWHVHLSFYRRFATDRAALQRVADVFTGRTGSDTGGGTTPQPEADPMPKQITLSMTKPMAFRASQWRTLQFQSWSPQNASGGQSAVLPAAGGMFICTLDFEIDRLPERDNCWVRVQTLDRAGKQRALFRNAEIRGTTGMSALTYTRVGSVPRDTNIRIQIHAAAPFNLTRAQWRVLHW